MAESIQGSEDGAIKQYLLSKHLYYVAPLPQPQLLLVAAAAPPPAPPPYNNDYWSKSTPTERSESTAHSG